MNPKSALGGPKLIALPCLCPSVLRGGAGQGGAARGFHGSRGGVGQETHSPTPLPQLASDQAKE